MGEFQERSQQIYENLIEKLEEEGYSLSSVESNRIVDFIRDQQLESTDEFNNLVKKSKTEVNFMRSQNQLEGFQCGECGTEITFGTNAGTGLCVNCESNRN